MHIMVQGVDVKTFSIEELRHFCEEVFRYFDIPPDDARQAAAVLIHTGWRA